MADSFDTGVGDAAVKNAGDLAATYGDLEAHQRALEASARRFAGVMAGAFTQAIVDGRRLDDTLKAVALRLSDSLLRSALQPVQSALAGGLAQGFGRIFGGLLGGFSGNRNGGGGGVKAFASGGVIGTPTYFPLSSGGTGLAGEAGPEAILPLARGSDGRLGVAAGGGATPHVTVQIVTPDVDGFRRAEVHLAGQIARAVARGQRDL
ncbi:phage tail tape measure protein [Xanthobacteraceae bacterium Astr-EGSB]|uniref:phage tail tape measure protein n=1 Tax=Astrobacterium formosum TaxID=3069710 RepID=UPI0027B74B50|nr:phage tail tape measure protein [Xanthobacteraceae bacterium Astr-EGSB]